MTKIIHKGKLQEIKVSVQQIIDIGKGLNYFFEIDDSTGNILIKKTLDAPIFLEIVIEDNRPYIL